MATLFNTRIFETYQGLIKTIDNAVITASLKELTDGSGNQTGLYINTAGDFKVTNVLEWGSLKDTGTGVIVTRYVTSTDGIENFDNNTSLPTSAAVKLYVDSKFATSDTLQEVLSFGNTTGGNDIVVSASDDITFTDSSKILMGAGSDLQIYHDSSNISYIKHNSSSDFRIQTSSTGYIKLMAELENMAVFIPNSAVELYFDNSKKLATTNTGVDVTGNLVVSGSITGAGGSFLPLAGGTMTGNTTHLDNVRSLYGTSSDLQIYHDSSNSYIRDVGTGRLWIDSNGEGVSIISDGSGSSPMAHFYKDAAVELYYDNSKKFETTVGGASITGALDVTGVITADGGLNLNDNDKIKLGTSGDLEIYHDGSNSYIKDTGSGGLRIATNQFRVYNAAVDNLIINAIENGAVELYYNDSKKIETVTAGAKVTGNLEVTGTITGSGGSFLPLAGGTMTGNTIHNDNVNSIYGTASDFEIYHDGSNSYIKESGTGDFRIWADNPNISSLSGNKYFYGNNGSAELYYSGNKKLETTSTGISVTGGGVFTGSLASVSIGTTGNDISFSRNSDNYINAAGGTSSNIVLNPLNRFVVNTDNSERMRIDSSGNLGLGISSTSGIRLYVQGGSGVSARFLRNGSFGEVIEYGRQGVSVGASFGYPADNTMTMSTGGQERVRIDASGRLGLGTSSPTEKLEVAGNVGINGFITHNGDSGTFMGWSGDDTNVFYTAGNERLRIDASGNVGIGSAPISGARLTLGTGALANEILSFAPATSGNAEFRNTSSTGTFTFTNNDGGSEKMRLTSAGDLLVGSTTGSGKLSVSGNINQKHTASVSMTGAFVNLLDLSNTSVGISETNGAGRAKIYGAENGMNNVSYCEYYIVKTTSSYAIQQIGTRLDVGNTNAQIEVQISGNYLQVKNVANSSLGQARIVLETMQG